MWRRILHFFRKPTQSDNLLAEFEDTLMLIVDPEQLTNNLLSKLKELISVEKAFVRSIGSIILWVIYFRLPSQPRVIRKR
ncbi:MAG: hypothetical protein ABIL62_08880 [Planctomycetota bacterium]